MPSEGGVVGEVFPEELSGHGATPRHRPGFMPLYPVRGRLPKVAE